jgi:hypothetical protein
MREELLLGISTMDILDSASPRWLHMQDIEVGDGRGRERGVHLCRN